MNANDLIQYFKPKFNCRLPNSVLNLGEAEWFLDDHPGQEYNPHIDWDVYLPKYDRNLQRPFVWTIEQKAELIKSILRDIEIAPLTIIQVRDRQAEYPLVWQIIDGKQRFSSILSYLRGEFPITIEGEEFYYNDLPDELQKKIKWFDVRAYVVYHNIYHNTDNLTDRERLRETVTDEDRIELYLYINYAGVPQDEQYLKDLANTVNFNK